MARPSMASRSSVIKYAADVYGTRGEMLWSKHPNYVVLRHARTGKWYATIMDLAPEKLGMDGGDAIDVVNVKLPPELIQTLLAKPGYKPAYHMNKRLWISVLLDGSVSDDDVTFLFDLSHESVS